MFANVNQERLIFGKKAENDSTIMGNGERPQPPLESPAEFVCF
jgi:hypothetical protein